MKNQNHELLIFLTFVVLIAAGTVALKLPLVQHSQRASFLDALFIATSAVCVTGLTTIPTSGFNFPGQIFILILIQVGATHLKRLHVKYIIARATTEIQQEILFRIGADEVILPEKLSAVYLAARY